MKVIWLDGFKIRISELTYDVIKKEMENYLKKGKKEKAESYSKLLANLDNYKNDNVEITSDIIETEVNKMIDNIVNKIEEIKNQIVELKKSPEENQRDSKTKNLKVEKKKLEKEVNVLSAISKRENFKNIGLISGIAIGAVVGVVVELLFQLEFIMSLCMMLGMTVGIIIDGCIKDKNSDHN